MKNRDANDVLREGGTDALREAFDKAERKTNSKAKPEPALYSVGRLRNEAFPMLKQIAGDIIVEGLTLLASRPKIGKTWLVLDVAIAVDGLSYCYCLGDIKCEQGGVLFLALEDNKRRMQRRLTKLVGVYKTPWPSFDCAHSWPRANEGGLERIRAWIEDAKKNGKNPRLVVIDVLARFRKLVPNSRQNSYEADYEAIAGLQKIASDTGVAIIVVHHVRKGEAEDPIDAVSGTLGLAGAADAVLVVDRNAQGVRLYGRSRDVDEIDKALTFNRDTCRWTILGEAADVQRSRQRQQIIEVLREEGAPMTAKVIAEATGNKSGNNRALLIKMAKIGEIERVERGKYTLPATPHNIGNNSNKGNKNPGREKQLNLTDVTDVTGVTGVVPAFRVVGLTKPGTTCVACHSAEGAVMKIRRAEPGSKAETLHEACAARWFAAPAGTGHKR